MLSLVKYFSAFTDFARSSGIKSSERLIAQLKLPVFGSAALTLSVNAKKSVRDALRHKLHELGFKEWQKSVFIYPYHCREQIDFVIEFFDLRPYVRQGVMTEITNETELKLHFKLK